MTRRRKIVRVEIGPLGCTYAYRAPRSLALGDFVRVHTRLHGELTRPVVSFGRRGHFGALKSAYPVERPSPTYADGHRDVRDAR
jgi:hypothetical protein